MGARAAEADAPRLRSEAGAETLLLFGEPLVEAVAAKFAEDSPEPDESELSTDVLVGSY